MNKRNLQVDGLRGIMALMIVIFHLFCRYLQIYREENIRWMSFWGSLGVTVFIIISGYFLGLECIRHHNVHFSLIQFYKKKFLRLWPCYILAISITMIAVKFTKDGLPGRECSWLDYLLNIFFINGFIGRPYVDGAHWYLTTLVSIIGIFGFIRKLKIDNYIWIYIVWLMSVFVFYKLGFIAIAGLGGGVYLGAAIAGASLAKIINDDKHNRFYWILLLIISISYSFFIQGVNSFFYILFGIVLLSLCLKGRMKIFEYKIFQLFGKISYPWYLIHQNIGFLIILELGKRQNYRCQYSFIALMLTFFIAVGFWVLEHKIIVSFMKKYQNN